MSDWMEHLPGIKDVIDGTGEVAVITPRYAKLQIEGSAQVIPDPVNQVTRIRVGAGGVVFTQVQLSDVVASFGQHVLLGADDPMPSVTLPLASGGIGRVGVTATGSGGNDILAQGGDGIHVDGVSSVTINLGETLTFQSDGVATWWIVSSYSP